MKVLVVATDAVGASMAGPGIRSYWFARELAAEHDVTLVVPFPTELESATFAVRVANPWHAGQMTKLAQEFDAVIAQYLPVPTMRALAASKTRAIYDLYSPPGIEQVALVSRQAVPPSPRYGELSHLTQQVALESGDAFLCASERQRDLWLGALMAVGRIDPQRYLDDPSMRRLIDVVPFGLEPEPPQTSGPVLKGVVDGIGAGDHVLIWGGGVWNWFDPLTVISAVSRIGRPDVKLYFLGTRHPNPGMPEMEMTRRAIELAEKLGVRDRSVFFNLDWVPYEQRGAYLLESDLGVSAHFDELETRFAFRTRLLDCFWASLPVVVTEGDALADVVAERGVGRTVPVGDVDAWVAAITSLLDDPQLRERLEPAFQALREELAWPRAVDALRRLVADEPLSVPTPPAARLASYALIRARLALETRGPLGLAARAGAGVWRRVVRDRAAHPPR